MKGYAYVLMAAVLWGGMGSFSRWAFQLGLTPIEVAFWAYCRGLQRLPATRAAVAATFEPVVAAIIAYLWWNEQFTLRGYAGTGLVLLGIGLMVSRPDAIAAVNRPLDQEGSAPSSGIV